MSYDRGQKFYTVTLELPHLPGVDHFDAGETFARAMGDWLDGAIDTLALGVTDEETNGYHIVDIRAEGLPDIAQIATDYELERRA